MHTMRKDSAHHSAAVWRGKAPGIMPSTEDNLACRITSHDETLAATKPWGTLQTALQLTCISYSVIHNRLSSSSPASHTASFCTAACQS